MAIPTVPTREMFERVVTLDAPTRIKLIIAVTALQEAKQFAEAVRDVEIGHWTDSAEFKRHIEVIDAAILEAQ